MSVIFDDKAFDLMGKIAHVTNGKFVTANEFSSKEFKLFNENLSKTHGKKVLIWNSPWILGALIIFLGLEWYLRKKRGLP